MGSLIPNDLTNADPCLVIYYLVRLLMIASVSRLPDGFESYAFPPQEREQRDKLVVFPSQQRVSWLRMEFPEEDLHKGMSISFGKKTFNAEQLEGVETTTSEILDSFSALFLQLEAGIGAPL